MTPKPYVEPADWQFPWLNDTRALFIIVFVATLFTLPILIRGLPNGDDAAMHYRRANDFIEALREGQLYPRWLPNSNYKQGNPVMLYYPPLPYYVVAAFHLVVRNPMFAVCLGCWFALTISGLTMYRFSRTVLAPGCSLLAAVVYTIAPYHLFDLYHRSALSEFWAFAWLPLVAAAAWRLATVGGLRASLYFAFSYALLLLTHVTIAFEMTLFLPLFFLLLTRDWRRSLQAAGASALSILMSAMFLVPLIFEVKYIRIDRALRIPFTKFFLFEQWRSLWRADFFPPPEGRRFYYLDSVNLTALSVALLFIVSAAIIWRNRQRVKPNTSVKKSLLAAFVVSAISLLFTTRLSALLWENLSQFAYIQFPFRWLTITILSVAMLVGGAAALLAGEKKQRTIFSLALALTLVMMLGISALLVVRASYNRQELDAGLSALEVAEYRTIFLDRQKRLDEFEKPPVLEIDGNAEVQPLDDFGYQQSYQIHAATTSTIKLRTLYFPGWVARVEGNPLDVAPGKEGTIEVTVEPGDQRLTLNFEDTPPRTIGKYLSLFGWLGWCALAFFSLRKKA
ncbi:MAG: hypothetical protein HY231_21515 [Acidobacteria bacterium]|nr:hypothetical protein [Acidobacteriota bacterium]